MNKAFLRGSLLALACMTPSIAGAATIFHEDFSNATPGTYGPGQIPGTSFTLDQGNIDIVGTKNGTFFSCNELSPGGNCLDLVGDQGPGGTISSTTFSLVANTLYTLTFDAGGAGGNLYAATIDGFSQEFTTNDDGSVSHLSFSFTPLTSTSSAVLSFTDLIAPNRANGAVLANISLDGTPATAGAVPEPASWAMMIVGLGMMGAGLRYRRRATIVRYV